MSPKPKNYWTNRTEHKDRSNLTTRPVRPRKYHIRPITKTNPIRREDTSSRATGPTRPRKDQSDTSPRPIRIMRPIGLNDRTNRTEQQPKKTENNINPTDRIRKKPAERQDRHYPDRPKNIDRSLTSASQAAAVLKKSPIPAAEPASPTRHQQPDRFGSINCQIRSVCAYPHKAHKYAPLESVFHNTDSSAHSLANRPVSRSMCHHHLEAHEFNQPRHGAPATNTLAQHKEYAYPYTTEESTNTPFTCRYHHIK